MPLSPNFTHHISPDMFSHQSLELTFRLLRYNDSSLAGALKKAIETTDFAPAEATQGIYTGEMHLNTDLLKLLGAETIVKVVSAVNDIGQMAVERNDLSMQHMKILGSLIEDWAKMAEWILQNATSDKNAFI